MKRTGHSRIPIHGETLDEVLGFVHVKDLMRVAEEARDRVIDRALVRDILFVPESAHIRSVLGEMRQTRIHFAVVVDEHGSTAGIITMDDVLAYIFGPPAAEARATAAAYQIRPGLFTVPGDMKLVDGLFGALTDTNVGKKGELMGLLTERLADRYGVTREEQDEMTLLRYEQLEFDVDVDGVEHLEQVPREGRGGGAALCIYHRGEPVVDCWAGTRDEEGTLIGALDPYGTGTFAQAGGAGSGRKAGAGLGLNIAKLIVQQHGGRKVVGCRSVIHLRQHPQSPLAV